MHILCYFEAIENLHESLKSPRRLLLWKNLKLQMLVLVDLWSVHKFSAMAIVKSSKVDQGVCAILLKWF